MLSQGRFVGRIDEDNDIDEFAPEERNQVSGTFVKDIKKINHIEFHSQNNKFKQSKGKPVVNMLPDFATI